MGVRWEAESQSWTLYFSLCNNIVHRSYYEHFSTKPLAMPPNVKMQAFNNMAIPWAPVFTAAATTRLLIKPNCESSFCALDTCPLGTGLRPPTHFPQVTEQLSDGIIWSSSFGAACRSFLKHYTLHNMHD